MKSILPRRSSFPFAVSILLVSVLILTSCQLPFVRREQPPCAQTVLLLAGTEYPIKTVKPNAQGVPEIPPDTPTDAYWLTETSPHPVIYLNPTDENLILARMVLLDDAPIKIIQADCNSTVYAPTSSKKMLLDSDVLFDPSTPGITIIISDPSASSGWVLQGELAGGEIQAIDTPDPNGVLAEISLIGTTLSEDGTTIRIEVGILNTGASDITFTSKVVSFLVQGAETELLKAEPRLPRQIAPLNEETFTFTFPRPGTPGAILKIFDAQYEIDGY